MWFAIFIAVGINLVVLCCALIAWKWIMPKRSLCWHFSFSYVAFLFQLVACSVLYDCVHDDAEALTVPQELVLFSKRKPLYFDFTNSATQASPPPWLSFSGGTNGTVTNSAGNIVAATTPRFDYTGGTSNGLLIEESRTNLFLQSSNFTSTWTLANATASAGATTAPDGTLTANSITVTSGGTQSIVYQSVSFSASSTTFSFYAKAGTATVIYFYVNGVSGEGASGFNLSTGSILSTGTGQTASITSAGNGWYRCIITVTTVSGANNALMYLESFGTNTITGHYLYLWGAQAETGVFPTSYIPTTTAAVTRSADIVGVIGPALAMFKTTPGSVILETANVSAIQTGSLPYLVKGLGSDGLAWQNTSGSIMGQYNGSTSLNVTGTSGTSNVVRTAFAWWMNGRAIAYTGAPSVVSDSNTYGTPLSSASIGSNAYTRFIDGYVRRIAIYPYQLPNTQLQANTVAGAPLP